MSAVDIKAKDDATTTEQSQTASSQCRFSWVSKRASKFKASDAVKPLKKSTRGFAGMRRVTAGAGTPESPIQTEGVTA